MRQAPGAGFRATGWPGAADENPPVTPDLAATLRKLPDRPGVYLMKDVRGDVLYVGKAQSLRGRVRSYWQKQSPGTEPHRIRSVIDRVADLEYTLTDSVSEALLLEADGLALTEGPTLVRALRLYGERARLDFADAYLAAAALGVGPPAVASFDDDRVRPNRRQPVERRALASRGARV